MMSELLKMLKLKLLSKNKVNSPYELSYSLVRLFNVIAFFLIINYGKEERDFEKS